MSDRVSQHLATISGLDLRGHAEAKRIREKLAWSEARHKVADTRDAVKAAGALRRHIKRRLAPHDVKFRAGASISVNYTSMTASFHCAFDIWPDLRPRAAGYKSWARTPIRVEQFGARDAAEMEHILTGLREAADRLALMLFTPSGERANA